MSTELIVMGFDKLSMGEQKEIQDMISGITSTWCIVEDEIEKENEAEE